MRPDVPNSQLYLVLEGSLSVELEASGDVLKHVRLGVGECAGEISLVDGKPPSALVLAEEPTKVLCVPHDTVWSLVDHSHEVARNLLVVIASRMRNDNKALVTSEIERIQYQHQASVDPLTGVHNRLWMYEAFPRALRRCVMDKRPAALMVIDIDHFKQVNDTHGHQVGDSALKFVASSMEQHMRPHDLLVRYGGEEFVMLSPDTNEMVAFKIADRLRQMVADTPVQVEGLALPITISVGLAQIDGMVDIDAGIRVADMALYRAKENGRNRVEVARHHVAPDPA